MSITLSELRERIRALEEGGGGGGVGSAVPVGAILPYGGAAAPTDYLLCDGAAVSRTTYAALFTAIGTGYGVGNGTTTFNLPDLRQRFPLGKAAAGTGATLGGTGGTIDHVHTGPSHTHTQPTHTHTLQNHVHNVGIASFTSGASSAANTGNANSTGAFPGGTGFVATPQHQHTMAHTHAVDPPTTATGNPTTLPASGADGGDATGASGTANTGTANPPFQTVNYIIRSI